jgi:hypothetical protein
MKAILLCVVATFAVNAGAQAASGNEASSVTAPGHTAVTQNSEAAASRNGVSESGDATASAGRTTASAAQASNVSAELTKKVDSKDAKVGDAVEAKTTSTAQLSDGTKLPKGTRLVGHVTEVTHKSADQKTSRLAFGFDHAILRDGREVPIHSMMTSLSAPAPVAASGGMTDDAGVDGGGTMGGARAGGGMRTGGGGLLSSGGSAVRGGGNLAGGAASSLGATTNNVGATAAGGLDSTARMGTQGLSATTDAAAGSGAQVERLPVGNLRGVSFYNAAGASSSTTLESTGKNIHLDSGSQMTLSVAASH